MYTRQLVLLFVGIFFTLMLGFSLIAFVYNPFAVVFQTNIKIFNNTDQSMSVTPLGTYGATGKNERIKLLPTYMGSSMLPSFKKTNFNLEKGESNSIYYDFDDVHFDRLILQIDQQYLIAKYMDSCCNSTIRIDQVDDLPIQLM